MVLSGRAFSRRPSVVAPHANPPLCLISDNAPKSGNIVVSYPHITTKFPRHRGERGMGALVVSGENRLQQTLNKSEEAKVSSGFCLFLKEGR